MSFNGPRVPNEANLRDAVTDGPVPEFEAQPQISLDTIGVVAPGDVITHGDDQLIVTDIELGDRPEEATLSLFNQRTTETMERNAGKMADLIARSSPTHHFSEVVIPADATYHVEDDERDRGLPHPKR